jgi:hypothetical protein
MRNLLEKIRRVRDSFLEIEVEKVLIFFIGIFVFSSFGTFYYFFG